MDWLKYSDTVALELGSFGVGGVKKDAWNSSAQLILTDVSYTIEIGVFGGYIKSRVSMKDSMKSSLWNIKLKQTATLLADNKDKQYDKSENSFIMEMDRSVHETFLSPNLEGELDDIDNVFTVLFEFEVIESFGVKNLASAALAKQWDANSDVSLLVEDKEIRVNKGFLSTFSPFFSTLFHGNFKEKDQDKIEHNDIFFDEMAEFLMILHGVHTNVNARNYVYLLKLSDLFQVASIKRMCEEYMLTLNDSYVNGNYSERLVALSLAEQYQLPELQERIVRSMDSLEDLKSIIERKEFLDLSSNAKAFVLQYSIKNIKEKVPKFKCNCEKEHAKAQIYCYNCSTHSKLVYC